MRYDNGYIQIARRDVVERLKHCPNAAAIYLLLRSWANYREGTVYINQTLYPLGVNQVVTGVYEIGGAWKLQKASVNKSIKLLKRIGLIEKIENKGSCRIFTLASPEESPEDPHLNNKEIKNKEIYIGTPKPKLKSKAVETSDFDKATAKQWLENSRAQVQSLKPNVEKCEEAIRKLRTTYSLSEREITELSEFVKQDDFWKDKALTPVSLLKTNKEGILKFQQILAAKVRSQKESPQEHATAPSLSMEEVSWHVPRSRKP